MLYANVLWVRKGTERFFPPLLCDSSTHPSGQAERAVMKKKRVKRTSTGRSPGALSRLDL